LPKKFFKKLSSPQKIQDYLNTLKFNFEKRGETCMSPRMVMITKTAHCMEGAMLAAAALEYHGAKPLVMDLRAKRPDVDHIVALFRYRGFWGGITKTNHAVLRYREPVYKNLRELAISFFHEYFDSKGFKTLREYAGPINLNKFNGYNWRTSEEQLFFIPQAIDATKHHSLLSNFQLKNLRVADKIEIQAGKLVEWKER
jgi:hypothetical protein